MKRRHYILVTLEQRADRSVRALVEGPGTGAGVWYWAESARDAAELVENLNISYSYARELRSLRRSRPPRRRRVN